DVCSSDLIVQIWHVARAKEGPPTVGLHSFHKEVGNPVGRVHVVGTPALVAGVAPELQEVVDVEVPRLQIRADGAAALASLVYGDGGVVGHFEKGDDALAFAVGPLDVAADGPHWGPVVAQAAAPLGEHRVVVNPLKDSAEIVRDRCEKAR